MPLKRNKTKDARADQPDAEAHLNFLEKEEEIKVSATQGQEEDPEMQQEPTRNDAEQPDSRSLSSAYTGREHQKKGNQGNKPLPRSKGRPQRGFDIL
jgi:hypothetical protein